MESKAIPDGEEEGLHRGPDNVIVIDDEDTDMEDEGSASEEAPQLVSRRRNVWHSKNIRSSSLKGDSDSSSCDEDDCHVLEPGPSRKPRRRMRVAQKKPSQKPFHMRLASLSDDSSSSSSSSDCEIVEDPQGRFRQHWEKAALTKQMNNAARLSSCRVDSEGSTSASNRAARPSKASPRQPFPKPSRGSASSSGASSGVPRKETTGSSELQDSNSELPADSNAAASFSEEHVTSGSGNEAPVSGETTLLSPPKPNMATEATSGDESHGTRSIAGVMLSEDLIMNREALKQTAEFKHADEEEWAQRQMELQRQAQEAQRLRKRRKAEAERQLEMENRQKQRLEEMRRSQKMEEKNMDLKEQVRGTVRAELERKASTCVDMATLLRRLGVHVSGGSTPTPQQVNLAYKQALLRFHPDRVAALAKSDPLRQVEAEETFKLISRLRNTLEPVMISYFK